MKENGKNRQLKGAEQANKQINEAFQGEEQDLAQKSDARASKPNKVNERLNDAFSSDEDQGSLTPASYLYNNTPAVDVTKDKDNNR